MEHPIFQRIENAPNVDFGDILSKSFDLFKKVWLQGFLHLLVVFAITIPFLLFIYIPLAPMYIDMIQASVNGGYYEPDINLSVGFLVIYVIGIFILTFIMQVFQLAVIAHFYLVCKQADTGQPVDVGGYFSYLKGNFSKLLTLSLTMVGIALLAALLCYLPIFYVMVPLALIQPIFAFNKEMGASEMIKAAFKLGNKFWLIVFGLLIIGSLLSQLGIILCGIGLFFTAYFVHIPMYYFYKDSVGFDDLPTEFSPEVQ